MSVMVFPASIFRPLSQMAEAEFDVSDLARKSAHDFRGRIGRDPGESRSGMANIRIGEVAANDNEIKAELYQLSPAGLPIITKPTANAVRARQLIEGLANPKSKERKPLAAAQSAMERLYQGRLFFAREGDMSGWHDGAYTLAANVCYCLRNELGEHEGGMTPQFIFALLYDPAQNANNKRLEGGLPGARPLDVMITELWGIVKSVYRRHRFQRDITDREREEEERAKVATVDAQGIEKTEAENLIKTQLKEWFIDSTPGEREKQQARDQNPSGHVNEFTRIDEWVSANWFKYLALDCQGQGRAVLSLRPGGKVTYSQLMTGEHGIYIGIRDCGHHLIQDTRPPLKPGDPASLLPVAQILRECGSQCEYHMSRIITCPLVKMTRSEDQVRVTYVAKAAGMRTDIEPVFHPGVDAWLHALAGPSFEKLKDWLACYPKIESPIAGLYLQGAPGLGKGMLGIALKRLTESGIAAPFHQVIDQFQDTMVKTPFVWGDEETSSSQNSPKSVMNMCKKLVTGEFDNLNAKSKSMASIDGHWRVLFTANSDKLLDWKGDVNESDMGAITVRMLHILCDADATRAFLDSIGGRAGTVGWPERHIPQHIMWLAKTREIVPGNRLLVEGVRSAYHDSLAVNTTSTDLLVRTLGNIFKEDINKFPGLVGVHKHGVTRQWAVYVNLGKLRSVMVSMFKDDNTVRVPQQRQLKDSIKTLCANPKLESTPTHVRVGSKVVSMRMWSINAEKLVGTLEANEHECDLRQGFGAEAWEQLIPQDMRLRIEGRTDSSMPPPLPPPQRAPEPIRFPMMMGSSNAPPPPPPRPAPPWPVTTKTKE